MKKFRLSLLVIFFWASQASAQPWTVVWTETFDSNPQWYASNGVWEMGTPTSGPDSAHSAPACGATVLAGNYTDGPDSRLAKVGNVLIPDAIDNPRLRFWHWFSISSDDWGKVQISADNGATWTDATTYTYAGTGSSVWTVDEIDLKPWAGQSVIFGFYFNSHNPIGSAEVSSGWYVDDLEIRTGPYTFNDDEGFEDQYMDWSVQRGTWEIGSPSSGPGAAKTGLNCAATRLSGNYDEYVDSRLRSSWTTLQSASQNPRLRFWHWYSISSDDNARVQLRTLTSGWVDITTYTYGSTGSDVWTVDEIDLRQWGDSTVQFAFDFHSHNPIGSWEVSSGWFIDDIEIRYGPYDFSNPNGFENLYEDWSVERGTWEIGEPASGPGNAHSGSNCAATVLSGNYHEYVDSRLRTTWFSVPDMSNAPGLWFWHWFSFSSDDYANVQVRTVNNPNWQVVSLNNYTGSSTPWTQTYISLSAYADSIVQLGFYFHSHNPIGSWEVSSGWYIDDVYISGMPVTWSIDAGPDILLANCGDSLQLGNPTVIDNPVPIESLIWSTTSGFVDSASANPWASPVQTYYLTATDSAGSMFVDSVLVDCATGVVGLTANRNSVYPNPFTSDVQIQLENSVGIEHISIMDIWGREVDQITVQGQKTIVWDSGELPKGVYIITAVGETTRSFKVVKQ